jgi:hypothetical protein
LELWWCPHGRRTAWPIEILHHSAPCDLALWGYYGPMVRIMR